MEELTPKKITARSSVCRLCGCCYESRHMLRIFGKSGSDKDMCSKVKETCGIRITEDDSCSKLICRKCEAFVFKMSDFKQRSKNMQIGIEQPCSVKRCVKLSPLSKQPSKRLYVAEEPTPATSAKKLLSYCTPSAAQGDLDVGGVTTAEAPTSFVLPKPQEGLKNTPLLETREFLLNEDQKQKIIQAAKSKQAVVVADIIKKHCPNVLSALKLAIADKINSTCKKLCKRSDGSVLFGTTYESLNEFNFDKVWNEMETNIPFLIDIFDSVSGKKGDIESTKHESRVKYSFLYSVLMNERWHELSLLKRLNTILVIEGGCTKQV